jgi:hypothetical protein
MLLPESNEPARPAAAGPQRVRGRRVVAGALLADRELGQLEGKSGITLQTVGQGSLEALRQAARPSGGPYDRIRTLAEMVMCAATALTRRRWLPIKTAARMVAHTRQRRRPIQVAAEVESLALTRTRRRLRLIRLVTLMATCVAATAPPAPMTRMRRSATTLTQRLTTS